MKKLMVFSMSMLLLSGVLGAAFLNGGSALAQPPDTLWTRTYGGIGGDYGRSVQQTTDGGYIISGYTDFFGAGSWDFYLVKTDAAGTEEWNQTFGGSSSDWGYDVQQTQDGGYVIGGRTNSYGAGSYDVYLIKTDASGDTLWTRTYGGTSSDLSYSVQQTTDGGYIVTGYTESYGAGGKDVYLVKTDASGNELWTQTFGGPDWDCGYSVQQTTDGGYIIAGNTQSYGSGYDDVYLIKTDTSGDSLWTRIYGGSGSDCGYSVQQTTDGGYIITGNTDSYGAGGWDVWLIKTDTSGDSLWTQTFGGTGWDCGNSVQQTTDGGYIVAGYTGVFPDYDVYLVRTDASGNEDWTQTFGGTGWDCGHSVQQTTDGGYIVTGFTDSYGAGGYDVYLIRLETEITDLDVTLTPHDPPIQIPAGGGSFQFGVEIENTTNEGITADAWIEITPPGGPVAPLIVRLDVTFPANTTISRDTLTQNVPSRAPAGTYVYACGVGEVMGTIIDLDQFTFEKLAGEGLSTVNDWNLSGWEEEEMLAAATPDEFALHGAHPNPFNPATTISYQLSAISFVNLSVYDVSGRLVAALVDGWRDVGAHEVTFDASRLASGVYIYRIETDNFSAVKKMVLMK